ncbi:DUF1289 domain-containing protein [Bosea sp. AAP35]|uniref:DUF1289 domain-containing protein n=1 Tax=Bosea sp. AAP35 TaxID=1523417 RepID=UPI0018D14524|nr:DUF1289 domain-containing protein [Bosea sp. AAP35]
MSSPCVKLCQLDATTRLCQGCGRSLDEIGRWSRLSEAERRAIMARLTERLVHKHDRSLPPKL